MSEREKRDEAMEAAKAAASARWKGDFFTVARSILLRQQFFTMDDLWDAGLPKPEDIGAGSNKACGPLLLLLARRGFIEKTERTIRSSRRHEGDIRVWKSLVYEP